MANWTILKEAIANVIKTNGNQEITGQVLQSILTNIVNAVGENATFAGVAVPTTNPGTPDGPTFYIPIVSGSYPNFEGLVHDAEGQIAIFVTTNNNTSWKKETISHLYTHALFNANIYTYGKKAYDKSLTLTQAIQAGKEAGINDVAKCICFFDGEETKLALFNVPAITSGWDNEDNWYVISKSVFKKITEDINGITEDITKILDILAFAKLFSVSPNSIYTKLDKTLEPGKKYIIALNVQTSIEPSTLISLSTEAVAETITIDIVKNKYITPGMHYIAIEGSGENFIRISDNYMNISDVCVYDSSLGDMYENINSHLSKLDSDTEIIPVLEKITKEDYVLQNVTKTPGYYKISDGNLVEASDTGYIATQKFKVQPGSIIKLKTYVSSNIVASYVFYKKDGSIDINNIGQAIDYTSHEILVPDGDYGVAFSCSDKYEIKIEIIQKQINVYTKEEIDEKIPEIVNNLEQGGVSKALSAEMGKSIGSDIYTYKDEYVPIDASIHTENDTNGYYYVFNGVFTKDNSRRATEKIDVNPGEKYKITNIIGSSAVIAYLAQWGDNDTWIGNADNFSAGSGNAVDREYIVPDGVTKIALSSYSTIEPQLKKLSHVKYKSFYNKEEIDEKIVKEGKYGIRWETNNEDDLGQRCFDAVGLTATAGIGNIDGHSDFDNIYPWFEMKRCNIKINSNGAKIVTFEGDDNFTLDGSNGDVFVRIPKFYCDKYRKNGYDYRIVSAKGTNVHPAFIEDGKELDEIFVAAFEGTIKGDLPEYLGAQLENFMNAKLYSFGSTKQHRIIPSPNYTLEQYLKFATDKGLGYTLYDMRSMDAIWTLFAVEYGCRNTNRKIAYGYCDLHQPVIGQNNLRITSSNPTNTIIIPNGLEVLANRLYVGSSITICKGTQANIIALRKIIENIYNEDTKDIVITFDGDPVSFAQDETDYFAGSGAASSNLCETLPDSVKLNWHTGRTSIKKTGLNDDMINPCRYRWIENPMGSLWHFFPDICFQFGQMYVCNNIREYKAADSIGQLEGYYPIGEPFEATPNTGTDEGQNGNKSDVPGNPNPFVIALDNDIFAKNVSIGRTYKQGITSKQSFGAYYYMFNSENQPYIYYIVNGGGFDHTWRSNMLTNRAWQTISSRWYLYGARLLYKNIK